jgi:tetratricopeptide (TPR) repeat protein
VHFLLRTRRLAESIDACEEGIRRMPGRPEPVVMLARLLAMSRDQSSKDLPRAITLAERAVEIAGNDAHTWCTLGFVLCKAGRWEESVRAFEKGKDLEACGDPSTWLSLSLALARLGRGKEAREWYERAAGWISDHGPLAPELESLRADAESALPPVEED